jgi:hypothetical protein
MPSNSLVRFDEMKWNNPAGCRSFAPLTLSSAKPSPAPGNLTLSEPREVRFKIAGRPSSIYNGHPRESDRSRWTPSSRTDEADTGTNRPVLPNSCVSVQEEGLPQNRPRTAGRSPQDEGSQCPSGSRVTRLRANNGAQVPTLSVSVRPSEQVWLQ